MRSYTSEKFSEVYKSALSDLLFEADFVSEPRNIEVRENIGVLLEFSPKNFIFKNSVRSSKIDYINGELEWYFRGMDDVGFISTYSGFWKNICNEDGSCNSAYGKLLFVDKNEYGFTQYQWALKKLKEDVDTRQSVMFLNGRQFQYEGNKDFVCTSYVIFFVREGKLYMRVHMRSNDAVLGTPNDVSFFSVLQQQMCRHINQECGYSLELGTYSHIVDSMHLYSDKYDVVERMLKEEFLSSSYVLDYDIIDTDGKFLKLKKIDSI